ncbi:hypothetical protein ACHAXT_010725 [Thalassiosira profunda]
MDIAGENRGKLAATLNAILAACCGGNEGAPGQPRISLAILELMDEMHSVDAETMVTPDLVSLSLAFYALRDNPEFESESQAILERAQRAAKKSAGSQRRKELAAERRKGSTTERLDVKQAESRLQSIYGPDNIRVLHDDEHMIIVSKPAGMVCYHTKKTSAGKVTSGRKKKSRAANKSGSSTDSNLMDISLVDALQDVPISLSTLNPVARGIVHRLDRGTSGSIMLAKTDEAHLRLVAFFFLRRVKKKYLALVAGRDGRTDASEDNEPLLLSVGSTGEIDVPVDGRPARSTYRVVEEYGERSAIPEALLLEVETLTGRKHQVRVHCSAALGRPIFLDPLYSTCGVPEKRSAAADKGRKKRTKARANADEWEGANTLPEAISALWATSSHQQERFFLHAKSLSISELGIEVEAPLPLWWKETLNKV